MKKEILLLIIIAIPIISGCSSESNQEWEPQYIAYYQGELDVQQIDVSNLKSSNIEKDSNSIIFTLENNFTETQPDSMIVWIAYYKLDDYTSVQIRLVDAIEKSETDAKKHTPMLEEAMDFLVSFIEKETGEKPYESSFSATKYDDDIW